MTLYAPLVTWLLVLVSAAAWIGAAFLRPRTGEQRQSLAGDPLPRLAGAMALLACGTAVWTSTVPGILAGQKAWTFSAVCLGIVALLSLWRAWEASLYAVIGLVLAVVGPIMAAAPLDPVQHDIVADAQSMAAVASFAIAGCWLASLLLHRDADDPSVAPRLRFVSTVGGLVVLVCGASVLGLTPRPWFWSSTIRTPWIAIRMGLVVLMAALAWLRGPVVRIVQALLGTAVVACTVATHLGHPMSDSLHADVSAFGWSVEEWPTLHNLVWHGRVNLFFLLLAVGALLAYSWLLVQLRRRGDGWPIGRTIAWVVGWLLVVWLTSGGVGRYAPASFSIHMFVNLGLNMAAAMVLCLGGFITLVLRAMPARRRDEAAGVREWVAATMKSRYLRFIYNPIIALVFMTGSYYVFYLTSIYPASLQSHWLHQFVYLHFLLTGYIFYGLIIGVDQPPHPLPHIGKLGLIIGAMPFHAFFGVIVMAKQTIYSADFLNSLGYPWVAARGLVHDQYVGGSIAWAGGEFPLVIALVSLLVQWQRQDSTEARRADRHFDKGTDDAYDAYNEMMARLAAADQDSKR